MTNLQKERQEGAVVRRKLAIFGYITGIYGVFCVKIGMISWKNLS
jgi:hypothetical protein